MQYIAEKRLNSKAGIFRKNEQKSKPKKYASDICKTDRQNNFVLSRTLQKEFFVQVEYYTGT